MSVKIKGSESAIKDIFCEKYDFHIPPYQRPYAWTEEEAVTLFTDLNDFINDEGTDNNYFLGSIVLEKEDDEKPFSQVIDGQQRLTTLTILLSVLISKFQNADTKKAFEKYIRQPADISQGLSTKPRLELRKKDKDFFNQYIQNMDFESLFSKQIENLADDAQKNIYQNALAFSKKIDDTLKTEKEKLTFGQFIINNCYLVVVTTSSRESAFRVFSVMNNRGLDLLATDIIKSDVIGVINDSDTSLVENYTNRWEELETIVGRNSFNELFGHIRTLKAKNKAKKSLIEEFSEYVLPNLNKDYAIDFITNTFEPYANSFNMINNASYKSDAKQEEINSLLKWLNTFNHSDWIPNTMFFISENENNPNLILLFLQKMERLCAFMYAAYFDINSRIKRFAEITKELENNTEYDKAIEIYKTIIDFKSKCLVQNPMTF